MVERWQQYFPFLGEKREAGQTCLCVFGWLKFRTICPCNGMCQLERSDINSLWSQPSEKHEVENLQIWGLNFPVWKTIENPRNWNCTILSSRCIRNPHQGRVKKRESVKIIQSSDIETYMTSHKDFYGITWYAFHDNEMRTIYIQFQLLVQLVSGKGLQNIHKTFKLAKGLVT